jgi:exosome complex component RRP40
MEPEVACVSSHGKKEGFGPLLDGFMFQCHTGLAREYASYLSLLCILILSCLVEDSLVLLELGKYFPYEVAVGINGRIWVNSTSPFNTILVSNAIQNSSYMNSDQISSMVNSLAIAQKKEEKRQKLTSSATY